MIVDSTLFTLAQKPKREYYYDSHKRKDSFNLTNLLFSDPNRKIHYLISEFAGSAYNHKMWVGSKV
jgi:hypothetical protein